MTVSRPLLRLLGIAVTICMVTCQSISHDEMSALFELFTSTSGESWLWQDEASAGPRWNFTAINGVYDNPCSSVKQVNQAWQGVTCSQPPSVCATEVCGIIGLELPSYHLRGVIPLAIGNLTSLSTLYLQHNSLSGSIPSEIGLLTALKKLSFYTNVLTGCIPSAIGQLQSLVYLELDTNLLSGSLPNELYKLSSLVGLAIGNSYISGTISDEIGSITSLQVLSFYDSSIDGRIPSSIGNLTAMKYIALYGNSLSSSIPETISTMSTINRVYFDDNLLTGTIPNVMCDLTTLRRIELSVNNLSGMIPPCVGRLLNLERLQLHINWISGTLPSDIGLLTNLEIITLDNNLISGTFPAEIGYLTSVELLYLLTNQLTGTIPPSLGNLSSLSVIHMSTNDLTGGIPDSLSQLTTVEIMYLSRNILTGTIPSSISNLVNIERFSLGANALTGAVPNSLGFLKHIEDLWLNDNQLSGSLPSMISMPGLTKLRNIFLQNNAFTGSAEVMFNSSSHREVSTLDISNNLLSGSLPTHLLRLPELKVLALSVNCFEGELQETLCAAPQIEVYSLNGLQAAKGCSDKITVPLSNVRLFNDIGGTVPECLWNMLNLTVLHLSGNGLSGELVDHLPINSQIKDVSLSHNRLSGTISGDILSIENLDLSYNRFEGEYPIHPNHVHDANISLEINRLSGHLPASVLESILSGSLNILRGNLFSCLSVPGNDIYSKDYICGSRNLNEALTVFAIIIGVCVGLVIVGLICAQDSGSKVEVSVLRCIRSRCSVISSHLLYVKSLNATSNIIKKSPLMRDISRICESFGDVRKYAVQLLAVMITCVSPLFILRLLDSEGTFSTHSNTYAWLWTLAYMRGLVPASLLLMAWAVSITVCFYYVIWQVKSVHDMPLKTVSLDVSVGGNVPHIERDSVVHIAIAFFVNTFITVTVNVLYILSTQQAMRAATHFYIQLSLSLFRLLYVVIAFPFLSCPIKNLMQNVRFRFLLIVINNLLVPCVVTAFTSDACFQGLLIPADSIRTPYTYRSCIKLKTDVEGGLFCSEYSTEYVDSASLTPPFTYNFQCGSVILTAYLPVFLLSFSVQLFLPFCLWLFLAAAPNLSIPPQVRNLVHGVLCPANWKLDCTDNDLYNKAFLKRKPRAVLETSSILCNDVLNNWLIMLTFGLASPVLAVAIVCVVVVKMCMWNILVCRFVKTMQDSDMNMHGTEDSEFRRVSESYSIVALAECAFQLPDVLTGSYWRLVTSSALFVALLSWDMACNSVGWLDSLWVPLVPPCYVFVLWSVSRIRDKVVPVRKETTMGEVLQSPLHLERL